MALPQARWMVSFVENPNRKWMITRGTPIFPPCYDSSSIPICRYKTARMSPNFLKNNSQASFFQTAPKVLALSMEDGK